jgi:hypothetical protein
MGVLLGNAPDEVGDVRRVALVVVLDLFGVEEAVGVLGIDERVRLLLAELNLGGLCDDSLLDSRVTQLRREALVLRLRIGKLALELLDGAVGPLEIVLRCLLDGVELLLRLAERFELLFARALGLQLRRLPLEAISDDRVEFGLREGLAAAVSGVVGCAFRHGYCPPEE